MKFINYLESISGVGIYPLTSLLIFFLFFIALSIRVYRMDKRHVNAMNHLPLEDGSHESNKQTLPGKYPL